MWLLLLLARNPQNEAWRWMMLLAVLMHLVYVLGTAKLDAAQQRRAEEEALELELAAPPVFGDVARHHAPPAKVVPRAADGGNKDHAAHD